MKVVSVAVSDILLFMLLPEKPSEVAGPPAGVFATTRWSVVVRAGDSESPEAGAAMERLCRTYWYPLYCFVRRKGHSHEDASDLTQGFFALFLEKRYLKSVDASRGKFRTFLLASMKHFLANEWDKSQTLKRGGGARVLSLDDETADERYRLEPVEHATPETLYERRWAETVVSVVLERLAAETEEKRFEVLKVFLLDDKGAVSFEDAAAQLGMTVAAVTSAIHRLRARFVALLVAEVENTVNTPEEAEAELRSLLSSLAG
jgi:DNA-directed RNA polymerase specialized sigma24 family protein